MADQSNRSYRGNDAYGRPQQGAVGPSSGGDPLAELARLIGQNDPFADAGSRGAGRRAESAADWRPSAEPFDPRHAAANGAYPEPYPPAANGYPQAAPPQHYDTQSYDEPQGRPGQANAYPPGYGAPVQQYGAPPDQGYADPYYRDAAQGDDMYEDVAPARRRGGMLTVMAVLALALIGTAAAFGYRAVFGSSNSSPPPVIKADTTPNKIVPAGTAGDQSKLIYDRVGDRSQAERIVVREEKPVDVNSSVNAPPRVVAAPPPITSNPMSAPPPPQIPANASALTATGAPVAPAPKRVRTVTIKPDDASAAEPPVARAVPPASVPPPARVASVAPPDALPPAPARPVVNRAPVHHAVPPAPNPNAPLSLAPPAAASPQTARPARMRTASAPPPSVGSASGAYTVQVSSQRSEAEAQSAFQMLQSKFPNLLGGRQPMIRRADLGEKGVFYRVQVGPFATAEQASELCGGLKAAGGQCVVQRN